MGGVQEALFITNSSGHSYYHEAVAHPLPTFLIPTQVWKRQQQQPQQLLIGWVSLGLD